MRINKSKRVWVFWHSMLSLKTGYYGTIREYNNCQNTPSLLAIFALLHAEKGEKVLPLAFAIGIGFGILENIIIYCNNLYTSTISWTFVREIGASLMHSACTAVVAMGLSYVLNHKKSFLEDIIGLFSVSVLFHATFNAFVQSQYSVVALIMPILLFIPINYIEYRKKKYFDNLDNEKSKE